MIIPYHSGQLFPPHPFFTNPTTMPVSTTSTVLNCPAQTLRDFLGTTANIPEISDPDLELVILDAPDQVTQDAVIEFRITAYGFKQKMKHRWISVTDTEIIAQQLDGPTRAWTHRQTIVSTGESTCELTDHIEFEPPGGMLGYVMTADKIIDSIKEGMEFRYETLQERLEC